MKIINLTPHVINVIDAAGETQRFEPSGDVARVGQKYLQVCSLDKIVLYSCEYGEVEGLPEPEDGTNYIVSAMVRAALPERWDLLSPGELVRGEDGQPIGCKGFVVNC